jgi:hypothetical protein
MSEFNIDTCKWIMWGARNPYHTHGHVHEAFLRALKFLGKEALWLEKGDDLSQIDFSNTCFITMNGVFLGIPRRKDCFYVVHNADLFVSQCLKGNDLLNFGVHCSTNKYADNVVNLGPDIYFDRLHRTMSFRWGTDLLPHEIEANKPIQVFNTESRVVNYIGTIDENRRLGIENFRRACAENGIGFEHFGGFNNEKGTDSVVSIEENVRLIRDSYMAPTLQREDQVNQGFIPCRLFKNISYGQFGITHSKYANDLFGGRLVYNPDTYRLFYDAKERLQSTPLAELHSLMDEVAKKHTYLNKIEGIMQAVRTL